MEVAASRDPEPTLDAGATAEYPPAVREVENLLDEALERGASDIHLDPRRDRGQVLWRVDGLIASGPTLDQDLFRAVLARLKVLAQVNLVERRRPQDGQFRTSTSRGPVDVRLSTVATVLGERAVLRLAPVNERPRQLDELGMPPDLERRLRDLVRAAAGLVVCVGPTGAGKTTTLYAALSELADGTRHLATIEDPVEHVVEGVTQLQVHEGAGVDFSTGLRALLRHDPDVILVGEIRDRETAAVAVRAALSGHLVLTTLHAKDATSALARLVDLGVDPVMMSLALTGVVAQRLLRHRRETPGEGPTGRSAVFELVTVTRDLRHQMATRASEDSIRAEAIRNGLIPLSHQADRLVARRIVDAAEVVRVFSDEAAS